LARKIDEATRTIDALDQELLTISPTDYVALQELSERRGQLVAAKDANELRWLELSELLGL
jgi:hypothetical protein